MIVFYSYKKFSFCICSSHILADNLLCVWVEPTVCDFIASCSFKYTNKNKKKQHEQMAYLWMFFVQKTDPFIGI